MKRIYLCKTDDIKRNCSRRFDLADGMSVVVFHTKTGFFAVKNHCPHAGGTLEDGEIKKNVLMCIWHGWKFNLKTGRCLNHPEEAVQTFPLIIEKNNIYIEISGAEIHKQEISA